MKKQDSGNKMYKMKKQDSNNDMYKMISTPR
jgi:hypothetical protein